MPPRSSLTSSFSLTDSKEEVVCPLNNQDGSNCRKRCLGEKRYRSMQEHIRRAHPEHYIPKLPATEESFLLMISTPPSETRNNDSSPPTNGKAYYDHHTYNTDEYSNPATPRHYDDLSRLQGKASAAAALAELGGYDRDSADGDHYSYSDTNGHRPKTSVELPPINSIAGGDFRSDPFSNQSRRREAFPALLNHSPPGRSSTLPPLQRPLGPTRARKSSVSKKPQHKKKHSRGTASEWLQRIQNEDRTFGHDGRPHSAEPSALMVHSRWQDLIDAASMVSDLDDRTPMPQSPVSQASVNRSSLPPLTNYPQLQANSYQASPLQQALTPPSNTQDAVPFPSVESGESGDTFHMGSQGLSDASPTYTSQNIQIYCAACGGISLLKKSFACTECICGLCSACVDVLDHEHGERRKCPRCTTIGGGFKPFQLDIR